MSKSAPKPPDYIGKSDAYIKAYQALEYRDPVAERKERNRVITIAVSLVLLFLFAIMWSLELMAGNQAFLVDEREGNGRVKQCVYDYLGDEYVITIPSYEVCQPVIDVNDR